MLIGCSDLKCVRAATYCMGTLCESDEIKAEALELGVLEAMILVESNVDMEVKRNVGYFMALVSEQQEYHENITKRGGLQVRVVVWWWWVRAERGMWVRMGDV